MNANDVTRILARTVFPFRRWLLVPNVSWGLFPWELDLCAMAKSGHCYEIEIKVSLSDLKADQHKGKWQFMKLYPQKLRGMYYAMPDRLWDRAKDMNLIPETCGVIVIHPEEKRLRFRAEIVRQAKPNKSARPLEKHEQYQLARLGTMRFWSRFAPPEPSEISDEQLGLAA